MTLFSSSVWACSEPWNKEKAARNKPHHELTEYQKVPWYFDETGAPSTLKGKTALVTGSSSGIGMGVATELYRLGARVIVTSRSVPKAEVACATIKKAVEDMPKPGDNVGELVPMSLSLDDLDSVKSFAKEFCSRFKKLEYLCENAGIAVQDKKTPKPSKQGYEICYASNFLGHALLMELLLPTLLASAPARVSFTSSITHWGATPLSST